MCPLTGRMVTHHANRQALLHESVENSMFPYSIKAARSEKNTSYCTAGKKSLHCSKCLETICKRQERCLPWVIQI